MSRDRSLFQRITCQQDFSHQLHDLIHQLHFSFPDPRTDACHHHRLRWPRIHERKSFTFCRESSFSHQSSSQRMIPLPINNKIISYIGGCLLKLHFWMFRIIPELCHIEKVVIDHSGDKKNGISGSSWSVQLFIFSSLEGESTAGIHCKFS